MFDCKIKHIKFFLKKLSEIVEKIILNVLIGYLNLNWVFGIWNISKWKFVLGFKIKVIKFFLKSSQKLFITSFFDTYASWR